MNRHAPLVLACLGVLLTLSLAAAADWPMWRCDVGRTAASPESLPAELHLQWTRELPRVQCAWPNESRLHFDTSYEPVVAGKTLFLGSPNESSVTAYDTETGQQQWRFYAEGPVRFAPVMWQGKLYFGSDDGYLYCLNAADGKLLWKLRGAPQDRPDYRHLGNNRLVSFWPVRGGPVLADGVVYFAAGIWPTFGVFVLAVDAQTGKVLWVNSDSNYLAQVRIDHNTLFEAGLSPQGYLLVSGDKLLVPNGRSFPARLDRQTGKLLYYVQGYRHGDCRVTTLGKYAFVGDAGVMSVEDGREVGSRWAAAGADAPNVFDGSKFDLFEGPIDDYKFFPACDARSVLTPAAVYGASKGTFYAHDLTQPKISEFEKKAGARTLKPWRWDLPELWKLPTEQAKGTPPSVAIIKAGSRLYSHAGKTLLAVELPPDNGQPQVVWQQQLEGTPTSLAAADGKLFVATAEGGLLCFGGNAGEPYTYPRAEAPLPEEDAWSERAAEILQRTGVSEGFCVVLGLTDGGLVTELLRQSKLRLLGVDADSGKVNALRDRLVAAGLYGTRAEVFVVSAADHGDPNEFRLPPYLASLLLTERPSGALRAVEQAPRLFAMLRPYGGVLCQDLPAAGTVVLAKAVEANHPRNAKVEESGRFLLLRREGALPGSADWTHETADAARSYFSKDQLVQAPLGVLWYGDGADYGFFKTKDYGVGVKPQVVGGRLFAFQIHTNSLHALDVYTGRLLWKQPVEHFTRYASMEDGIYVAGGDKCVVYDPATGKPLKTFPFEAKPGAKSFVSDIRVGDDVIVIAADFQKVRAIEKGLWDSKVLVALERQTGKQLWAREAQERFNNNAFALGAGLVFCADSPAAGEGAAAVRKGELPKEAPSAIMALDARTGETKWTATTTNAYRTYNADGWLSLRGNDDWLAYSAETGLLLAGKNDQVRAFDAMTGKDAWQKRIGGGQPLLLRHDTFINQAGHTYNVRTGELVSGSALFVRGGCNYAVAGEHLLFVRDRCVSYVELDSRAKHYLRNIRSGCSNSLVAAGGLLNAPCFSVQCICNYPIQTSFAMVHLPEVERWAGQAPVSMRP